MSELIYGPPQSADDGPARLLWIEDEPSVVRWGSDFLRRHRFVVDAAATGSHGLARAQVSHYALIILDWRLPEPACSGSDVLAALRAHGVTAPVLVCSGADEEHAARKAGARGFYLKPLHGDEFLGCLRRLLRPSDGSFHRSHPDDASLSRRDQAWRERLLVGDLAVCDAIAAAFLPRLRVRLRRKLKGGETDMIEAAAEDALMAFFRNPGAYDGRRIPLEEYLLVIAKRRASNALMREVRHQRHHVATGLLVPESTGRCAEQRSHWRQIRELLRACWTPGEKAYIRAKLRGESRSDVLARLLGAASDSEDGRRECRKALERIRLRIKRS